MNNMKKRKGFTLAEILIVVALLGILMTVLLVSVGSYFDKTRETGVRNDFNNMKTAIEVVMRENSGLPKKSGASTGDTTKDAALSFNKTVNLINDYLDPNMKWVDANDEDGAGYVVVSAAEGQDPVYTELTDAAKSNTKVNGTATDGKKIIVSTKTDSWKYNYSIYFQRRNEPDTTRNADGDKVGRLDKVLVTSWGSKGNEHEAQYAMLVEYDKGTITIAQAGFQGENLNTLRVGQVAEGAASGTAYTGLLLTDKSETVTRKNAVGTGFGNGNNATDETAAYSTKPTQNLIYGSIISPNTIIADDINNFGNADLSQFDAMAYNS